MTLRVLAIGDLSNNIVMFKKFVKSDIHLINFPWDGPSKVIDIKKDVVQTLVELGILLDIKYSKTL